MGRVRTWNIIGECPIFIYFYPIRTIGVHTNRIFPI